jgi:hypothetical protein
MRVPSHLASDGNVFVRQPILVLRGVRQRLDDEPHRHAVLEHAVLDRALGADEREDARTFVEIDERLEVRRPESLRSDARDRVALEPAGPPDLDLLHGAVAATCGAHWHFRKHHDGAIAASTAEQRRRLPWIGGHHDAGRMQQRHGSLVRQENAGSAKRPNAASARGTLH